MAHALREHGVHVIVGKRVDDALALALELDEPRLLEDAQLMGYGALRGAYGFGDVGYAEILLHEGVENLYARGVRENLEQVSEVVEDLFIGHARVFERFMLAAVLLRAFGVRSAHIPSNRKRMNNCSYVNTKEDDSQRLKHLLW